MEAIKNLPRRTSESEKRLARKTIQNSAKVFEDLNASPNSAVSITIPEVDGSIEIPKGVFDLLLTILSNMAEGKAMTLIPVDAEMTTQQAAEMLNVSRPHLVYSILDKGMIPYSTVGRHRRIKLKDVLTYIEQKKKQDLVDLQKLTERAQNLNLGY